MHAGRPKAYTIPRGDAMPADLAPQRHPIPLMLAPVGGNTVVILPGRHRGAGGAERWALPSAGPPTREGRGERVRGQAIRGRVVCQTVGRSGHARAALLSRWHTPLTTGTPVSAVARRVPTSRKHDRLLIACQALRAYVTLDAGRLRENKP